MGNLSKFKELVNAGRYIDAVKDRTIWDEARFKYEKLKLDHEINQRIKTEAEALKSILPAKQNKTIFQKIKNLF